MNKRYFHTFDALRFFAFFKVFLLHLPLAGFPVYAFISAGGGIGVQFFFVLSGFLITYLLTVEKQKLRTIHFGKYFTRRVLRIWPLYFALLAVSAVIAYLGAESGLGHNSKGYEPNWWMSLFFLENYQMLITGEVPKLTSLSITWSVCIEEHFYLLWGLVFALLKFRYIQDFLILALISGPITRWLYLLWGGTDLDLFTNMDLFAAGGILGWATARNHPVIKKINQLSVKTKWVWVIVTLLVVVFYPHTGFAGQKIWGPFLMAVLFTGVLAACLNPDRHFGISDHSVFSTMGRFTYGLYLTHIIIIQFMRILFIKLELDLMLIPNAVLFFVVTFALCLLVARISYVIIEEPFLKLKNNFYALEKESNSEYASYRNR